MDILQIAKILVEARKADIRLPSLPSPEPTDLAEAYKIQDATIDLMGITVTGWKVGATSDIGMQALGIDHPISGPLFDNHNHPSPAAIHTADDCMCIIEAEFAISLKHDLPPRERLYTMEEADNAIAAIHPAIEVVNTRCIDGFSVGVHWVVADGAANQAFIYGDGFENWRQLVLPAHPVFVEINGAPKGSGSGAAVLGNPLKVFHWAINHLSARNITVKAGQYISTGITTPVITALTGDVIEADFGILGTVELEIQ